MTTSAQLSARVVRFRLIVWLSYFTAWSLALLAPIHFSAGLVLSTPEEHYLTAKLVHIGGYAGLAFLTGWLRLGRVRWLLLLGISAHAAATEYLQTLMPPRTGSALDVAFNHLGIVLGVIVSWKWWRDGPPR